MTALNLLEYAACATSLISTYLHGRVNRVGPALSILCALLYLGVNIGAHLYVAAVVCALAAALNVRNLLLWSHNA